jgi:penicillin-binding protein 1C
MNDKKRSRGARPVNEREGYVPAEDGGRVVEIPQTQNPPGAKPDPLWERTPSDVPFQRPAMPAQKQPGKPARKPRRSGPSSKLARGFLTFAVLIFVGFFAVVAVGVGAYIVIASQVPDVSALRDRQSTFASTRVFDANGSLLIELTDPTNPNAGLRQYVRAADISDMLKQATIATEDPRFYKYQVGFDPLAILRVLYDAWQEREFTSGGSTITQQVARNLLLDATERNARTPMRKIREIIIANEMSRRYSRDEILEIYLNEIYYANQAYGIEAAAQTYFGKPAKDLDLAEATFLAGIPQSPVLWDPVRNPENARKRQSVVLRLMAEAGFIAQSEIAPAQAAMLNRTFSAPTLNVPTVAPHFFYYLRDQLDREYGAKGLYRDGLRVYTSIDPRIQQIAETAVRDQLTKLRDKNVTNAAVVVIRPATGEILAMVGSADFNDVSIDGQVNVAVSTQQPGSTVKPFVYLAGMEKGLTASTLYWDAQRTFVNQYGQSYTPRNYDGKFHGPMLMREALARSMNIAAVETLEFVTVPGFLDMANRVGLRFPPNDQYGLAITLGGADSTLLNLTQAYAVLANNGLRMEPTGLRRVETADGRLIRDYTQTAGQQVIQPAHAYLITDMLSDNNARIKTFGRNSVLNLPFPAAAKTGTTNDFRDNLTAGYTADMAVAVWVGNSDNSEMRGVSGISGAAPIWRQIMIDAHADRPAQPFVVPPDVVSVEYCAESGRLPSPNCPNRVRGVFKTDQMPLPADEAIERAVAANDPNLLNTAAPPPASTPQSPDIVLSQPANGQQVPRSLLSIEGLVNPSGFQSYQVEFGEGDNPGEWKWVSGPHLSPVINGQLTQWGLESLAPGRYTLRVTVFTNAGPLVGYSRFDVLP